MLIQSWIDVNEQVLIVFRQATSKKMPPFHSYRWLAKLNLTNASVVAAPT
jgi:hypothetical protein